jgi:hypothetical protein
VVRKLLNRDLGSARYQQSDSAEMRCSTGNISYVKTAHMGGTSVVGQHRGALSRRFVAPGRLAAATVKPPSTAREDAVGQQC